MPPLNLSSHLTALKNVSRSFHTTTSFSAPPVMKRKKMGNDSWDRRITLIRHHLFHPRVPRVLRLSRHRYMRHWTIATAWKLFNKKKAEQQQLELKRQYQAMEAANEQLRILGDDGVEGGENVGRRYRECMNKGGVWDGVPVEYARTLVDWPSRDGWNHEWKRI